VGRFKSLVKEMQYDADLNPRARVSFSIGLGFEHQQLHHLYFKQCSKKYLPEDWYS
jgi:hypothetical protein